MKMEIKPDEAWLVTEALNLLVGKVNGTPLEYSSYVNNYSKKYSESTISSIVMLVDKLQLRFSDVSIGMDDVTYEENVEITEVISSMLEEFEETEPERTSLPIKLTNIDLGDDLTITEFKHIIDMYIYAYYERDYDCSVTNIEFDKDETGEPLYLDVQISPNNSLEAYLSVAELQEAFDATNYKVKVEGATLRFIDDSQITITVEKSTGTVEGDKHEFHVFKIENSKILFELDYIVYENNKELEDMQYRDITKIEFRALVKFLKENNYEAEWEEVSEDYYTEYPLQKKG